jgi:hypothetical protein
MLLPLRRRLALASAPSAPTTTISEVATRVPPAGLLAPVAASAQPMKMVSVPMHARAFVGSRSTNTSRVQLKESSVRPRMDAKPAGSFA